MKRHWSIVGKVLRVMASLFVGSAATYVQAADWPSKQIKFVVPYVAGGGTDALARVVANKMSNEFKQSVIVLNRPSGKSIVAYQAVVADPADGYTFLFNNSSHAIQVIYKDLPYHPFNDLKPVGAIATGSSVLVASPSLGVQDFQGFLAYAKAHPHEINYGSYGVGTNSHLQGELLNAAAGIDMVHVPYKGSAAALNDLLGGHIQVLFVDALAALPLAKAKKVIPLAMVGTKRPPSYADLPTFGELGYADLSEPGWWGLFARSETPPEITAKVDDFLRKAAVDPDVQKQIMDLGAEPDAIAADAFSAMIDKDKRRWSKIVEDRHIEVE